MRLRSAKWREENAERNRQLKAAWFQRNKAKLRARYVPKGRILLTEAEKKARKREYTKRYAQQNREKLLARHREQWKDPEFRRKWYEARNRRFKENPEFLLRHRLRVRMKHALKGHLKAAKTMDLIGCSSAALRKHIESQWTEGMDWTTYGLGHGKWQIDHVRPLVSFALSDPEQQRQAFHFSNLKPEWWVSNAAKSGRSGATPPQSRRAPWRPTPTPRPGVRRRRWRAPAHRSRARKRKVRDCSSRCRYFWTGVTGR